MRHLLLVLTILFLYSCTYGNKEQTDVLLYYNDFIVPIYNSKGEIIGEIMNNIEKDEFVILSLNEISGNKAHVTAKYVFDDIFSITGYIQTKYLGIRTINSDSVFLYEFPSRDATIADTILDANWTNIYRVTNVKQKWLYIEGCNEGRIIKGWLSPNDQCADPVTIKC